jgi:3-phosphoshikimate 1-carboxyvinyltransferase
MADKAPEEPVLLPDGAVARGTVVAPPSKSHAIRGLICMALAIRGDESEYASENLSVIPGGLPEDVLQAASAVRDLGWDVDLSRDWEVVLHTDFRRDAVPRAGASADVGGSATALRFLTAVAALGPGPCTISGSPQLLRRPAGSIVAALRALGVTIDGVTGADGVLRPPLVVSGGPPRGGDVAVDASSSSHALSALLLIAPVVHGGLRIRTGPVIASRPYVELTIETMRNFGVEVEETSDGWRVAADPSDGPQGYPSAIDRHTAFNIEGDWSSAAFLLAAAAATGGDVTIEGLNRRSVQADRRVLDVLTALGAGALVTNRGVRCTGCVSRAVEVSLSDAPDLAPLVGALACLVPGTSRVRGAAHLRIKETDRIAEVVRCARAWGCEARELPDGFEITGPAKHGATIDPAGDHRLAMAFAVAGLAVPGTRIADPGCVAKSYPAFWQDLAALTGDASLADATPREPG